MAKFSLAIAKKDLEKINQRAMQEEVSRAELIRKAISYGINNEIIRTVPNSYKPKHAKTITVTCSDELMMQLNRFVKKHRLIKSRWIVGLIIDKYPSDYLELKYYGEQLGYELHDSDIAKIRDRYSIILQIDNKTVKKKVVEQYISSL